MLNVYFSLKKLITNNIRVHTVNISTSLNAKINVLKHLVLICLLHFYNKIIKQQICTYSSISTKYLHIFENKEYQNLDT